MHYADHGTGTPVLALHGWAVDHRSMTAFLEPFFQDRPGYRRIYPDLPGMGQTPAAGSINGSDDILEALFALIDEIIGDQRFLLAGHSHGGYMAQAIAAQRPHQVAGLALVCALGPEVINEATRDVPEHVVTQSSGGWEGVLDPELETEFRNYFVIQTPETLKRFQEADLPGFAAADFAALERMHHHFDLSKSPADAPAYTRPTLIVAGRQDSTVGYTAAWQWLERYPRATFAVLDNAGHALPHEQTPLLHAMLAEWLDRTRESTP